MSLLKLRLLLALFVSNDFVWWGGVGGYDQLCRPASPKLLLGLDLGLGCDKNMLVMYMNFSLYAQNSPITCSFVTLTIIK